jgi:hypothetical protein
MKKISRIVAFALLLAVGFTVNASAQTGTVTFKYIDKYLGSNGGIFFDGPVIQPDIFVSFQNGVYADLWASRGDRGQWGEAFDSEIDFNAGWADENFDVGVLYIYSEPSASDVLNLYATATTDELVGGIKVFFKLEHYLAMEGNDPGRGSFTHLGLKGDRTLGNFNFGWTVEAFYDTGAFGFSDGTLVSGKATLLYDFGQLSLGPMIKATTPIHIANDDGREFDYAVGLVSQFTF